MLLLSWLFSELCLATALSEHAAGQPLAIPLPGWAHRASWHTVHAPARGQEHSLMGMQQGQPWRLLLAIPAVITWQPRANFPIDHVWRVGEKNNLPHSNSSEPSFQRLCHEQNESRTTLFCCPKSSAFLNHSVLWLDPALTAQQPVGEGLHPFCTNPDTFR